MYAVAIEMWLAGINNTILNDWHCLICATETPHNRTMLQFCQMSEDYSFRANVFSASHYQDLLNLRVFLFVFILFSLQYQSYFCLLCIGIENAAFLMSFLLLSTTWLRRVSPSAWKLLFSDGPGAFVHTLLLSERPIFKNCLVILAV